VRPRLVVVGGESEQADEAATPEIGRLRRIAFECGVADRVTFVGQRQRQHLRSFYAAADVFVTTPWYEPFGITPLEAMACARPVVGSNVGGIKHTVIDGVTGYLVPPRDPQALAERLSLLQKNPSIRADMGLAGLHRARSRFTWERVAHQLADVYAAVRDEAAGPQRRSASPGVRPVGVQVAGAGA
jgi:D-inositol-3-phosphate glycosyltransferase